MATTKPAGVRQVAEVTASDSPKTLAPKDYLVLVDTSTGAVTLELPTVGRGMAFGYKIVDAAAQVESNNITLQTEGSEQIVLNGGGGATQTLSADEGPWEIEPEASDGDWVLAPHITDHDDLQNVAVGQHRSKEQVEDIVGALISAAAGSNVSVTYDDGADTLTIDTTALDEEEVEDAVNSLLTAGSGINLTYDDAGDSLTISADREQIEDWVGALISAAAGSNISVTYDDAGDSLTIDTTALNEEEVEDAVSNLLAAGSNLAWTYDDVNDTLTVSLSGPITGVQIGNDSTRNPVFGSTVDGRTIELDQSADDGTDRYIVRGSDGNVKAEIYFDGTNTVINPLSGDVDVQGALATDSLDSIWKNMPDFNGVLWLQDFDSLTPFLTTTSGTGSVSVSIGLRLGTGTTSGSTARAFEAIGASQAIASVDFSKNQRFRTGLRVVDDDGSVTAYITIGRVQNGNKGYGFKMASGDWQGVVHNGTSENTTTLQSNPGTGNYDLRAVYTGGTDVEFFINGTSEGTISSGLPSGGTASNELLEAHITNSTAADRRIRIGEYRFGQEA